MFKGWGFEELSEDMTEKGGIKVSVTVVNTLKVGGVPLTVNI